VSPAPKQLADYVLHLQELSESEDPSALLAHAYVRYLGDLSGGQVIRRRVVKAYGLDAESGLGLSFYSFKQLGGSKLGTVGDMKKVKEWYREGMDSGVGDNRELKGES
jgi:heme oxygenase (biliverdin-producing, ferredoxin)